MLLITTMQLTVIALFVMIRSGRMNEMYTDQGFTLPLLTHLYVQFSWVALLLLPFMFLAAFLIGKYSTQGRLWQNVNAGVFMAVGFLWLFGAFVAWFLPMQPL